MPDLERYNPLHVVTYAIAWLETWQVLRTMPKEDRKHLKELTGPFDPDDFVEAPRPE